MAGFSAEWLSMREPYDHRARNRAVLDAVRAAAPQRAPIRITDLASGTGSSLRALAPVMPQGQNWRLLDHDPALLAQARMQPTPPGTSVATLSVKLDRSLDQAFAHPADLVTTSAFLDLVSADWLAGLVAEAAARALPVYAGLTYDGRLALTPHDPLDTAIINGMNRHQRGEKGFGLALGPTAAPTAIAHFERAGYAVAQGRSDWVFGPHDTAIQIETLAGLAKAAVEAGAVSAAESKAWLARRNALVAAGRSSIRVGHIDFFARPAGRAS